MLNALPDEIIYLICEHMKLSDMCKLSLINKYMYNLIETDSFYRFCKLEISKSCAPKLDRLKYTRDDKINYIRWRWYLLINHDNHFKKFYFKYRIELDGTGEIAIFGQLCESGNLTMAQWLFNICPYIKERIRCGRLGSIFFKSYDNGHFNVVKWLGTFYDHPPMIYFDIIG